MPLRDKHRTGNFWTSRKNSVLEWAGADFNRRHTDYHSVARPNSKGRCRSISANPARFRMDRITRVVTSDPSGTSQCTIMLSKFTYVSYNVILIITD